MAKKKKSNQSEQLDYTGLPREDVYFLEKRKALKAERRVQDILKKEKWDSLKEKLGYQPKKSPVDVAISRTARKVISKIAPKGSIVKALTSTAKKTGKKGRGRPKETYKVRYVPGVGAVKVPTHIYKKMMAKAKADARLARVQQELAFKSQMEQRQMQAEQIAMQQDPRFQAGADDSFLAEPDQVHEMNVALAQQQAQQQEMEYAQPSRQGPGVARRFVDGVSRIGTGISRLGGVRQQPQTYVDEYGRPVQMPQQGYQQQRVMPTQKGIVREPRVTAISEKANLLRVGNQFNRTPQRQIAKRRLRR